MDRTTPEEEDLSLSRRAWAGLLWFLAVLALMIFLPAWTLAYWQAWIFIAHFTLWMVALSRYFLKHDPALVRRRMNVGPTAEREPFQKRIQAATSLLLVAAFVVPALDHRLGWSALPVSAVVGGHLLLAAGYFAIFRTFQANSFASAVVEVGAGQRVISTGPYALVRHPMYVGAILLFLGVPLALGSWWGLLVVPPLTAALALRAVHEESLLVRDLAGYAEYRGKVRHRFFPAIW
ncbi:MAG TPA: isoprenylcysteine carboxylmethyltransferase family protein [Candidatus Cybelea sp.]|nr:isoprenylcysteine carboxylmethyltransferase family protein [Candidatus Cybelea sp.]